MLALENADEILQILDRFTKQKSNNIPPELEEYINYVAKTGDTVYRWPAVQYLFREKLRNVIKDFHDTTASIEDLPQCPNVDQFNYESMKTLLFERFDNFQAAPFTIQRMCELLTDPKKHYSRLDKFMRALEKNILVVSTVEPGRKPIDDPVDDPLSNDNFLPEINIDMEISKSEEKKVTTNGIPKYTECNDHVAEEVPSSSGISQIAAETDAKKEEETKETKVTIKQDDSEKPVEPEQSTASTEPASSNGVTDKVTSIVEEAVEAKPIELTGDVVVASTDTKEEIDVTMDSESNVTSEKKDLVDNVQIESKEKVEVSIKLDEAKKDEEEIITKPTVEEIEKPSTPKRACSTSDDEDADDDDDDNSSKNPSAKKIRLEMNNEPEKVEEKTSLEPTIEANIVPEIDLGKETDILESLSSEIDAQKENELLEDVGDASLAVEKDPISASIEPIIENVAEVLKPTEEIAVVAEDLLKTDEPVAIPSDLDTDFTPDEALNELVSAEILSAIPAEQPAQEEVKMNDEPANNPEPTAATDEMNVENPESSTAEVENAMESAPIKADEEQMDVDESNSVDAMDL